MKKISKKVLLILLLVFAMGSVYAASRHLKSEAPVRFSTTLTEGETLSRTISCYDPDGDDVVIEVEGLPIGATVSPQVVASPGYVDPDLPTPPAGAKWFTRQLTWTPDFTQAGTYTIYIHATDTPGDDDWVKYEITVNNTNRPPVL